jgi:hypothetical protein
VLVRTCVGCNRESEPDDVCKCEEVGGAGADCEAVGVCACVLNLGTYAIRSVIIVLFIDRCSAASFNYMVIGVVWQCELGS